MERENFIHSSSFVDDGAILGSGILVWHFTHIRENAEIGDDCQLGQSVYIDEGVKIGKRCRIQNGVSVFKGVVLGDDVFVGPGAVFTNDLYPRAGNLDWRLEKTIVENWASIGANATIRCGITLGEGSMIGAGSVVTKDTLPYQLILGNPGKVVGYVCICGKRIDEVFHGTCEHK